MGAKYVKQYTLRNNYKPRKRQNAFKNQKHVEKSRKLFRWGSSRLPSLPYEGLASTASERLKKAFCKKALVTPPEKQTKLLRGIGSLCFSKFIWST